MSAQAVGPRSDVARLASRRLLGRRDIATFVAAIALGVAALIAATTSTSAAPACTRTWDGGGATASWSDADNWDGAGNGELPVATDHVCIPADSLVEHSDGTTTSVLSLQSEGTLTLSGGTLSLTDAANGSSAEALIQSGGTLGGAATLTILGTLDWTGGEHTDPGRTIIDDAATASIDTETSVDVRGGRTFENRGTTTWVHGTIVLWGAEEGLRNTLENVGTLEAQDGSLIQMSFNSAAQVVLPLLDNRGTFAKSAGEDLTTINVPVDNDGTLEATSGTIRLNTPGAGSSTGTFATSDVGLIEFFADHTLGTGAGVDGNIDLRSGTLTLATDISVPSGRSFTQSGGVLAGTKTLTILGGFDWTSGDQIDAGRTVIDEGGAGTIDVEGSVNLHGGRIFENQGTLSWVHGSIALFGTPPGTRTTIENSGSFEAGDDSQIGQTFNSGDQTVLPLFHNVGSFRKIDGTDATRVDLPFDNDGSVEAAAAAISFGTGGDGTATGTFTTDAGALIEFRGGSFELGTGAELAGDILLSSATIQLSADVAAAAGSFTQTGGVLGGSGTLAILDTFAWSGGEQTDAGRTLITTQATGTLGGSNSQMALKGGRTLENQGSLTLAEGSMVIWRTPTTRTTFENEGSLDSTGDITLDSTGGINDTVPAVFHNTGTFSKTGGLGETRLFVPFSNDGTVSVESGTIAINGDFDNYIAGSRTLERGVWRVASTLEFDGADIDTIAAEVILDGAAANIASEVGADGLRRVSDISPDGALTLDGGADLVTAVPFANHGRLSIGHDSSFTSIGAFEQADGATTLEAATSSITATGSQVLVTGGDLLGVGTIGPSAVVSDGTLAPGLSPGTLGVAGPYQQSAGGTLSIEIGGTGPGTGFDVLAITGAATLGGTLQIDTIDGFSPTPGDSFRILTAPSLTGTFASVIGTELPNGLAYTPRYDATGVTLTVSALSLSIDDVTVTEGHVGTVDAAFTVTLSETTTDVVTVDFTTVPITAIDPDDYVSTSGTLTFQPGETTKPIVVKVEGESLDEDDETFGVDLSNAVNAPIAKSQGVGTITDDDPLSSLSIAATPISVNEGDTGTVDATFTVTLTPATGRTVSVGFATAPGGATSPADFAAKTGTLTFDPGETTQTIVVSVKGDTTVEPDETFHVDLAAAVKAVIGTTRATATIVDDDRGTITIGSVSVDEGNSGTVDATFPVTLSAPATTTVTVGYATADDSATAPGDYIPASGTITWAPGESSKSVTIDVVGDTFPEPNETFKVNLANPVNAAIAVGSGTGTIADDGDIVGTPDYDLIITPPRQVLEPGGTVKFAIQIVPIFGFHSPVTLSALDLPAGITHNFSVNPVGPTGVSILTITAPPGIPVGEQGFRVQGVGGGITQIRSANTTLDFGLVPICSGIVDGYVTDEETGAPIKDAVILINPDIRTDDRGYYLIEDIQLDEHNNPIEDFPVTATKDGYWEDVERGLVICEGTTRIDLELLRWRPASVSGTVVVGTPDTNDPMVIHPTSEVIPNAELVVRNYGSDRSDAGGAFVIEMEKLDPRNQSIHDVQLEVQSTGYWSRPFESIGGDNRSSPYPLGTIDPDEHIRDLVVPLVKKCTVTLTGVATDAVTQAPIVNGRVTVAYAITQLDVRTDSAGRFTYPGVLLGHNNTPIERSVAISSPGYFDGFKTFQVDTCNDTPAVEIAMSLQPPPIFGTLEGHVYDAVTGQPLQGARVFTPVCATPPGTTCTSTDSTGFYRLVNVPLPTADSAVDVTFFAEHPPGYYSTFKTFSMRANTTTVQDFRLSPSKHFRLTGVVRDRVTGLPIENAALTAPAVPDPVRTDLNGRYTTPFIQLPAPGDPTAQTVRFEAQGHWGQTKSKAVSASDTAFELDFDLLPICEDATIQGTVVNAVTQGPIANADVTGGGQATKTAQNGTYKLEHLRVGTDNSPIEVTIRVAAPRFHPQFKTVKVFCNATLTIDFGRPPQSPSAIVIRKTTDPAGATQEFGFTPTWAAGFTLSDTGSKTFSGLPVGSGYSISESIPDGWEQRSATCSDGSPITNIDLAAGETVTCTFVNRKLATLTIRKTTDPSPDPTAASFAFTAGGGLTPTTFSLADGGTREFKDLVPKAGYSVAEDPLAGWLPPTASCSDGSPVTNIDLAAGEAVTCTFVNRPKPPAGTIIVAKTTEPAGSEVAFAFTRSFGAGFTLKHSQTQTFADLEPGAGYSVAETVPDGWQLRTATCDDGSPITNINLASGETVTCTFVNRQLATLVVRKQTQPSPDTTNTSFGFTAGGGLVPTSFSLADGGSRTFTGVTPATGYSLAETVPTGWQQHTATCDDGSPITNIDLAPGETVTCTFVNRKLATLVVRKQTQPNPDTLNTSFGFTAVGLTSTSFSLAGGGSRTFAGVSPGNGYSVAETVPAGWQLHTATCDDGSPITNIDLAPGETVTCTFVNRRLATLIVRKQTQPSPDQTATSFAFTAGGGLTPTSFGLIGGGSRTFADVSPGTGYSLAETVPSGWQRQSAACSDGSPIGNIGLSPGETVTCTFVNVRVPLASGAHTIGFWRNKNGQKVITSGSAVNGVCASATWLRGFVPFQDLPARSSCTQVASYATSVIDAANASGASMNKMLKAQMLATALSVFFSDPGLGGNGIGAPAPIGPLRIDLKTVCVLASSGACNGKFIDVSPSFGGAAAITVAEALTYAAGQSNVGGTTWYGNVKSRQELAKDLFDAINNNQAFRAP